LNPPGKRPLIIAHRGASGHATENSLEAFRKAAELGADGVELDVHATRDGRLVVFHDLRLPGGKALAGLNADQVRRHQLPNGEAIPFLEEVLEQIPHLAVWIELKALDPAWDDRLLACIDRAPAPSRCAVHSFDHRIIARLRAKRPGLSLGALSTSYPLDPVAQLRAAGADTLWQEWQLIDPPMVAQVHQAGCRVIAWTVNDQSAARNLAALGVDGLCGNYPERLSSL
jgi:glycerophosphoryl diester phosphodiesterase